MLARATFGVFVVVALAAAAPRLAAAGCVPALRLTGEAELQLALGRALSQAGANARGEREPPCGRLDVVVARERGQLLVTVRDARGRSEVRLLGDVRVAAAWVESWLHDEELGGPAAAARATSAASKATAERGAGPGAPSARTSAARVRPSFAARWVRDVGADDLAITGPELAVCLRAGRWCPGLSVRAVSQDFGTGGASSRRSTLGAAAGLSALARVAAVRIAPEVTLGVTYSRSSQGLCAPPGTPVEDPRCRASEERVAWAARLGAAGGLQLPISELVWFEGRLGAEVSVWQEETLRQPVSSDPSPFPTLTNPLWSWQGTVGLRVELP
ncbi:MAG: hypothetical protein R3B48_20910 [Kofleriaceae bacterium]